MFRRPDLTKVVVGEVAVVVLVADVLAAAAEVLVVEVLGVEVDEVRLMFVLLFSYNVSCMCNVLCFFVITQANESCGSKAFIHVCMCVRTVEPKWLKL